jgi:hypothetical protein
MIIKEGTKLTITHKRSGTWKAIALNDFDTDMETFWPVVLDEGQIVKGVSITRSLQPWREGDVMPCRGTLVEKYEQTGSIFDDDHQTDSVQIRD